MGWLPPIRVQIRLWKGVFQCQWTSGHAMRLNSQTGTEDSPVSSLNCDRSLHSGTGCLSCNECRLLKQIGVIATCVALGHRSTSTVMTLLGWRAGPGSLGIALWAWRTLGIYALRNEAAYTRHYKIWQQCPSYTTHLPLAELRTTYSQTNTLNLHT